MRRWLPSNLASACERVSAVFTSAVTMQESKKRLGTIPKLVLLLVLIVVARGDAQTTPGPTDRVATCIEDAVNRALECVDDLPWYAEWLCAARMNSDIIACSLEILPV